MVTNQKDAEQQELSSLCNRIRALLLTGEYCECEKIIAKAMGQFPDSAQPHNLFGLVLERKGNHVSAMKHFRAAWALDPTFRPARQNLEHYGAFGIGCCAFDESDCLRKKSEDEKVSGNACDICPIERNA